MLPPRSSVVIEELSSSSMIPTKGLLLKYHKPSSTPTVTPSSTPHVTPSPTTTVTSSSSMIPTTVNPTPMVIPTPTFNPTPTVTPTFNPTPTVTLTHTPNSTPSLSKRKFTKTSANRRNIHVINMELVPLPANVNVQEPEPLPTNSNTTQNETVESIKHWLRETLVEDEEDSGLEEGDSDSEDDEDYFVDEDKHKYCLRHIHENLKKQWNGQAYKELLWRCVAATTVPYFDREMEELKQFNKEAFEWLAKIPAHSRAKSDILLNNLCECFNGKILDARDAPIITALEYIMEYLMRKMVNVIVVINKTNGPLTPGATKLLKVVVDKANKYTVGFNGGKSMRMWELTGIPCAHAIATNYNMALNRFQVGIPEEWVNACYWLDTWKHAYTYTLGCLYGKVLWKKSQIPTTLTPPKHHTLIGRPKKEKNKRRKGLNGEGWKDVKGL
ncbi:hypothetical protein Tco_1255473 [Tanacetum coccineum]